MNRALGVLLGLCMICLSTASYAQGQGRDANRRSATYKIVGQIKNEAGKVLEYATISLLTAQDSSLKGGIVTDANGRFELEVPKGSYLLKVNYIGFEEKYVSSIQLSDEKPFIKVPSITLLPASTTLDEVEITTEKSRVQFALDKRVFNVGKDLNTIGGTASDLLDNIPSVTVDIEGEVSLRGSNSVRILINGRPSLMTSADALQQIPADQIDRVEIVTNPSARYEAEGNAGVINIILKKDKRKGWNGNINASAGYPEQHNLSTNINYRLNKLNLFAGGGFRYRDTPRPSYERRQDFDDAGELERIFETDEDRSRGGLSYNVRLGLDYQINKYNTLTGSLNYRLGDDFNDSDIIYTQFNRLGALDSLGARNSFEEEDEEDLDYNLTWEKTFAQKDRKWTTSLIFSSGWEREAMEAENQELDIINRNPVEAPNDLQDILNQENQEVWTFQSDYEHPFNKTKKFEAGVRTGIRRIDTEYKVEDFNPETQLWVRDPRLSNQFRYDENIYAAYASYGDKVNKLSYQVGLRLEHTDVLTELKETGERNEQVYTNLFPSLFLNYELPGENSLQVSYSRRVRRPRFWDLNPFLSFSNPLSQRTGNPNLQPEFTDSYEINYIKYFNKLSLNMSLYARDTRDLIQRIARRESTTDLAGNTQEIIIRTTENLGTRQDYGLEVGVNLEIGDWLDLNSNSNFYQGVVNGNAQGFEEITRFFSWTTRMTAHITIDAKTDAQLTLNYRGPEKNPQGRNLDFFYTDLGISRDILKGKATVNLRVRDVFNSATWQYEAFGDNFFMYREGRWRVIQQVFIGFNYRINQKKRRGRRGGREGYSGYGGEDK
ncbi:MAG: TonB-dependent receptor [Bacteroidota bacterium]